MDRLGLPSAFGRLRGGAAVISDHLAERALARATDAELIVGNAVRILRNADEHFPAWLDAIRGARRMIFLETYIVDDDPVGRVFVEALTERARAGVRVCVIFDWFGNWRRGVKWQPLIAAGGEVRAFNPPRVAEPFGWTTRDHRKQLIVDGRIGFVTGICLSAKWQGDARKGIAPWRDTGIEIRGPGVVALEHAFAQVWRTIGGPLPNSATTNEPPEREGTVALRVVAGAPNTASLFRVDHLIAAVASERLWLTDAYFVGLTSYVRALCAAARDGVDVRLLVPGASDLPIVSRLSRSGYRPLLEAGVRVFEWNGSMLHAKTAVADDRWARIGSTNLNLASWMNNYELDVAVEDEGFAAQVAQMYEEDLHNSTEILLSHRNRVMTAVPRRRTEHPRRPLAASAGRAAAGAVTVGSALGAALTRRRILGPAEASVLATVGASLCAIAALVLIWPQAFAFGFALVIAWVGLALLWRAAHLRHTRVRMHRHKKAPPEEATLPDE